MLSQSRRAVLLSSRSTTFSWSRKAVCRSHRSSLDTTTTTATFVLKTTPSTRQISVQPLSRLISSSQTINIQHHYHDDHQRSQPQQHSWNNNNIAKNTTSIHFSAAAAVNNTTRQPKQQQHRFFSSSSSSSSASQGAAVKKDTDDVNQNSENNNNSNNTNINDDESLKDTVRRMGGKHSDNTTTSHMDPRVDDFLNKASSTWSTFSEEVGKAWGELVRAGERKDINKKLHRLHPEDTAEGEKEYTGPVDIMIIEESEHLTAWERMQKRLADAPIIQDILSKSEDVYEKSGAKQAKQRVDHLAEDAREAWETSQNPWVYRISSVYETLTAETPESIAVAELRKLDPDFILDDWRQDVVEHSLPKIMEWLLLGKINQLKPWLADGVFQRIAAEITARKQEGVQIDTHVLGIMNSEILAVEPDEVNKGSPIIVLHFMCQQINCVRKKKDGEIVEGSEDDIRANSYVAAFQREYDEEKAELNWKIVDFRFNGAIAYL